MSIVLAIVIFSVLVLFHEFGHFIFAKKNGICVVEFSLGMGPRILSFMKGETRYSWKLIPFGGSCTMVGEDFLEASEFECDPERSFDKKSVWARISVVAAGPVFNFILAFVMALIVMSFVGTDPAHVLSVEEGSAAEKAGLKVGDTIVEYNGASVTVGRDIYLEQYIDPVGEDTIHLVVKRDGEKIEMDITPEKQDVYMLGMRYTGSAESTTELEAVEGGALAEAGVKTGDKVISIAGTEVENGEEMAKCLDEIELGEEAVEMTLEGTDGEYTVSVKPKKSVQYNEGFVYNQYREEVKGFDVIKYSFVEMKYQINSVFKSLKMLFTGRLTKDDVAGPVGIVDVISDTVEQSKSDGWLWVFLNMANMTIMLSANLGVMNLLPFPALDGGRLVFLIIEAVRGKPIPREKEGIIHMIGMILLMGLMVFILFNDIMKLFGQ